MISIFYTKNYIDFIYNISYSKITKDKGGIFMKKVFYLTVIMIFILSLNLTCYGFEIMRSPQGVLVDGIRADFEVYNIDGNNYFKLRDIASVLKYTSARFSVEYSQEEQMIKVLTNELYRPVGGEMEIGEDKSSTAVLSVQKIKVNGILRDLTAYNIGGNNFFKLRDLGQALNFEVDYEKESNTVLINSEYEIEGVNLFDYVGEYVKEDDENASIRINVDEDQELQVSMFYVGDSFSYSSASFNLNIDGTFSYYSDSFSQEGIAQMSFEDGYMKFISSSTDEDDILNNMTGKYIKKEYQSQGWNGVYEKDDTTIIISEIDYDYMMIYIRKEAMGIGIMENGFDIEMFDSELAVKEDEFIDDFIKVEMKRTKSGLIMTASSTDEDHLLNKINGEYRKIKE